MAAPANKNNKELKKKNKEKNTKELKKKSKKKELKA